MNAGKAGRLNRYIMQDALSFDVMRWLVELIPDVEIIWDDYSEERAMAAVWPRLIPLLEEDGDIEPNVPWQRWLQTAAGSKQREPQWMVRQFAQLLVSDAEQALLYDSLRLPVRWYMGNQRFSRTRNWRPVRRAFSHAWSH